MLDDATISTWDEEIRQVLQQCGVDDPRGYELFFALQIPARLLDMLAQRHLQVDEFSIPRLSLLFGLYIAEQLGHPQAMSPSRLSEFQHVSRNTISSLLRSLEEQGLIERELRSEDKRRFNIRLSPAGRTLVCSSLPQECAFLTDLFSDLSADEQATLIGLLGKLRRSLLRRVGSAGPHAGLMLGSSVDR